LNTMEKVQKNELNVNEFMVIKKKSKGNEITEEQPTKEKN